MHQNTLSNRVIRRSEMPQGRGVPEHVITVPDGRSSQQQQQQQQHARRKRSGMGARERTSELQKRQQKEKYQEYFGQYQQVKQDMREEETERLREKIKLQQGLIRSQDQFHEALEEERREQEEQKRTEEKQARKSKNAELEAICKQSLEDDRQKRSESRQTSAAPTQPASATADSRSHHQGAASSAPASASRVRSPGPGPLRLPTYITENTNASSNNEAPYVAPLTTQDSREDGFDDVLVEESEPTESRTTSYMETVPENLEELPWHHAQLYALYGDDADYFLHPKMQPETKAVPKMFSYGMLRAKPGPILILGPMGANELWRSLRNSSLNRLMHEDALIPQELKQTYSAFVRELLAQRKKPVKRNFFRQEDVPEMRRLMDRSKMASAQKYRHQMELMFRSSTMNEDKCRVLMFNNPPPDMNNWSGEESVQRYIPTIMEGRYYQDSDSEVGYKKWLSPREKKPSPLALPLPSPPAPRETSQRQAAPSGKSPRRRDSSPSKLPPVSFLTEEGARVPGEFSARHKAAADRSKVPPPAAVSSGFINRRFGSPPQSAPRPTPQPPAADKSDVPSPSGGNAGGRSSAPDHFQPLSMAALQEYKSRRDVHGSGSFTHGMAPVWTVQ